MSIERVILNINEQGWAKPVQLHWYYPLIPEKGLPEVHVDNPKHRLAIGLWRKMPVWLTRRLGPPIVRGIS